MKKEYIVIYPILGYASMTVEADSPEDAKEQFWNSVNAFEGDTLKNPALDEVAYDFVERVTQGNVCYADYNEVTVEQA